jgi:alkylation response protein AidB-like acyl-CoA dehydrogenase
VGLAKARLRHSAARALEATGQKLIESQEAAARVADMAMETYAMESAVVRARRMQDAGHRWAGLACGLADVFVNEAAGRVRADAAILLAEALEGGALLDALREAAAFDAHPPISSARIRDAAVRDLVEMGRYPIEQF